MVGDQCEFGECCPIYNFCRTQCCTNAGGNTCVANGGCHPSNAREVYCGAEGQYSNLHPCESGQPSASETICSGNLPANSAGIASGLCASFRNTVLQNPSMSASVLDSVFSPSKLNLADPACGCTDDVKALWTQGAFVGHWSGGAFIKACPGSGSGPNPTPTPGGGSAQNPTPTPPGGGSGAFPNLTAPTAPPTPAPKIGVASGCLAVSPFVASWILPLFLWH